MNCRRLPFGFHFILREWTCERYIFPADNQLGGLHKCDECDKAYDQNYKLVYHKRSVHAGSLMLCTSRCYLHLSFLFSPLATEEIRRPFPCETCGKRFPTRCQLKRHSVVHFRKCIIIFLIICNQLLQL